MFFGVFSISPLSMDRLSDPRRFLTAGAKHPLLEPVAAVIAAADLEQRARRTELRARLHALLLRGDDPAIAQALAAMPDALHLRTLFDELAQAVEAPPADPQSVFLRVFAFPLVLIAAAREPRQIAGSLPDVAAVRQLFVRSGALGAMRNFGLSSALCTFEALASLTPVALFNAARMIDANAVEPRLRPADLTVAHGREQAHLRFLAGAGVSRADAPELSETAGNIGAWGRDLSALIGKQLTTPGVQLLVLPRMPQAMMRAPHAGRSAQLDAALHLFISNTVRRFRMSAGDPVAILSTHDDADVRLTLSSLFADEMVEGFRWPLATLDDLDAIRRAMASLLDAVRISDVRVCPAILPAQRPGGSPWFPRADEWDALAAAVARH